MTVKTSAKIGVTNNPFIVAGKKYKDMGLYFKRGIILDWVKTK